MARKPRGFFKASDWELEDAEEESVEIVINHSPKAFVIKSGQLTGMTFDIMEYDVDGAGRINAERITGEEFLPGRRRDPRHRPGERLPLDRARPRHRVRQVGRAGGRQGAPSSRRAPGVFFGGDAAFGPKNIIWAVEHGHQAAISIHKHCQGEQVTERLPHGHQPAEPQDGHARVELRQRLQRRSSGG